MNTERSFKITEKELEKIFKYVISKPINEAIEVYSLIMEISRRENVPTLATEKTGDAKEQKKEKEDK